jgi:hypothetical protein
MQQLSELDSLLSQLKVEGTAAEKEDANFTIDGHQMNSLCTVPPSILGVIHATAPSEGS